MLAQFRQDPDKLSRGEQILSAIVGATLAAAVTAAITSVAYEIAVTLLL